MWSGFVSPIGTLVIGATPENLRAIRLPSPETERLAAQVASWEETTNPVIRETGTQLAAYFAGELTTFELPLQLWGSDFEMAVWHALCTIPYGETRSYGDIARQIGEPGAARAVGIANNRNQLPIVVPCHRVIGANGKLVGYGGGLERKRFLLELEARVSIERTFFGSG